MRKSAHLAGLSLTYTNCRLCVSRAHFASPCSSVYYIFVW